MIVPPHPFVLSSLSLSLSHSQGVEADDASPLARRRGAGKGLFRFRRCCCCCSGAAAARRFSFFCGVAPFGVAPLHETGCFVVVRLLPRGRIHVIERRKPRDHRPRQARSCRESRCCRRRRGGRSPPPPAARRRRRPRLCGRGSRVRGSLGVDLRSLRRDHQGLLPPARGDARARQAQADEAGQGGAEHEDRGPDDGLGVFFEFFLWGRIVSRERERVEVVLVASFSSPCLSLCSLLLPFSQLTLSSCPVLSPLNTDMAR